MIVLLTQREIEYIVAYLARKIRKAYEENIDDLNLLIVLKAGIIFASDLMRLLPSSIHIDFVTAKSYCGKISGKLSIELHNSFSNKDVLIVDTLCDTGKTISGIKNIIKGAKSIRSCVLVKKMKSLEYETSLDFVGLEIPNVFVYGYGLDKDGAFRGLPYIVGEDENE